jgi:uncharacterized protein involved in high-affinity Fe2+ transport
MRTANVLLSTTLAASVVLTGCGGDDPESEAPIGAVVRSERMDVLNLAIVTDNGEVGTLVGLVDEGADEDDALTGVTVDTERGPVEAYLLDGEVALPPDETVRLAVDTRVGLSGELPQGRFVEVTLAFQDSRTLSTLVPVEPSTGPYDGVEVPSQDDLPAG